LVPEQVSFAAAMPRDPAPGLTLARGVIPSGSNLIEIGWRSRRPHRPGVRPWCAFDGAVPLGWRIKSHCSRSGVCLQCDLMAKSQPKTCDFDWKGTLQTDYLGVPLMCRSPDLIWQPSSDRHCPQQTEIGPEADIESRRSLLADKRAW